MSDYLCSIQLKDTFSEELSEYVTDAQRPLNTIASIQLVAGSVSFQTLLTETAKISMNINLQRAKSNIIVSPCFSIPPKLGSMDIVLSCFSIFDRSRPGAQLTYFKTKSVNNMIKWVLYLHVYSNTISKAVSSSSINRNSSNNGNDTESNSKLLVSTNEHNGLSTTNENQTKSNDKPMNPRISINFDLQPKLKAQNSNTDKQINKAEAGASSQKIHKKDESKSESKHSSSKSNTISNNTPQNSLPGNNESSSSKSEHSHLPQVQIQIESSQDNSSLIDSEIMLQVESVPLESPLKSDHLNDVLTELPTFNPPSANELKPPSVQNSNPSLNQSPKLSSKGTGKQIKPTPLISVNQKTDYDIPNTFNFEERLRCFEANIPKSYKHENAKANIDDFIKSNYISVQTIPGSNPQYNRNQLVNTLFANIGSTNSNIMIFQTEYEETSEIIKNLKSQLKAKRDHIDLSQYIDFTHFPEFDYKAYLINFFESSFLHNINNI